MEQIIPISWLNKVLLITSIICAVFCLIIEQWIGLTSLPIFVSLTWCVIVITGTTWYSCYLLKVSLKANSPLNVRSITKLINKKLGLELKSTICATRISLTGSKEINCNTHVKSIVTVDDLNSNQTTKEKCEKTAAPLELDLNQIINEISEKFIENWYNIVSDEKAFVDESNKILKILFDKIITKISVIDKIRLSHKLVDILLLHLKEYRRALRRVEREKSKNTEEAYRCSHPGSRNSSGLEHTLHRLVTILAREFLQWELTSSLPCKLLLTIIAKKLMVILHEMSCPHWIFNQIITLLQSSNEKLHSSISSENDILSRGLDTGLTSGTAVVIPQSLPHLSTTCIPNPSPIIEITVPKESIKKTKTTDRVSLCLDGLSTIDHKGLWNDLNDMRLDCENEDDRISPVYEEPTDFATTIARLRNLLQQKSATTSPLPTEEKLFTLCDGNQFVNLAIPWTEFHTSADGSQQLLYCIQFDDVEQHGEDLFETTTATVRRQYGDFVQLHKGLEELPNCKSIMSNIHLPEGGRVEMESYLRTICTQVSSHTPTQLRHFLRPTSEIGKKADAVAPRFDRFLAKTVTGVFNTLRTVVPGFEMDQEEGTVPLPTLMPLSDIPWRFVEDVKTKNIIDEVRLLVADRIDYCTIDTAYEAVDSIEGSGDSELLSHWWKTINQLDDEELDELDGKLPITCGCIDLICEILAGIESNNTLRREAVVRWSKLFIGNFTEPLINEYIKQIYQHIDLFSILSKTTKCQQEEPMDELKIKLFHLLVSKTTVNIKRIFGEDDINKIIQFLLGFLENKKVNLDLILQILDILVSELLAVCKENYSDTVI